MLHFREDPDRIIVHFSGEKIVSEAQVQGIADLLQECVRQAARTLKPVMIDLGGVSFLSSAMIGALVGLAKEAKQQGVDLRMANLDTKLLELFKILRLSPIFRIDEDDPDLMGARVPNPKPPDTLDGGAVR